MASVVLCTTPILQFFNNLGQPNVGGTVLTQVGGVNTATYEDAAGTIPLPNPIPLNARGEVSNASGATRQLYLLNNAVYNFTVYDANNNQIATAPNVGGLITSASLAASSGSSLVGFSHAVTYPQGTSGLALQAVVNVKNAPYNAKGDGITDDTSAIAAAVASGRSVYFPAGTYLTSADVVLQSGCAYFGEGQLTIIKATADSVHVLRGTSVSNISIRDFLIDGGGQTVDVATGVKAAVGIQLDNVTNASVSRVRVRKCGVKNNAAPTTDSGFGGYGILISGVTGATFGISVDSCYVENIAGGGNSNGDGIAVLGQNANTAILTRGVSITNCRVSTVGRHCYSVSEGAGTSLPRDVVFANCYGEKSALSGMDCEDGNDIFLQDCSFSACGNDQTYLNPAVSYGATYRLLAGIATGNGSTNFVIRGCHATGCYYGLTWGGTSIMEIDGLRIDTSTTADLFCTLAASPGNLKMSDCHFGTNLAMGNAFLSANTIALSGCTFTGTLGFNSVTDLHATNCTFIGAVTGNLTGTMVRNSFSDCVFAGLLSLGILADSSFKTCTFKAGVRYTIAGADRNTFLDCLWTDYAGEALYHSANSFAIKDTQIKDCRFIGTGNLTNGVSLQFASANRWRIGGCLFSGLTGTGITLTNGNAQENFSTIHDNEFLSCANGIVVTQNGGINYTIKGNTFESISGWCIDHSSITAGGNLTSVTFEGNKAAASVTNGFRIAITTGAWDWCLNLGNDWHNASGTKYTVSAGNANGVSANNLTT